MSFIKWGRRIGGAARVTRKEGHLASAAEPPTAARATESSLFSGKTLWGVLGARAARLAKKPAKPIQRPAAKAETTEARHEREDEQDIADLSAGGEETAAALRATARCAAIFTHPAAEGRKPMAAELAFNTRMPRHQAIALLASTPTHKPSGGLAARMAHLAGKTPGMSATAEAVEQATTIAGADAICRKVAISPGLDGPDRAR